MPKSPKKPLPQPTLPPQYKHQSDPRTQTQIHLTSKLASSLSQLNLSRMRNKNKQMQSSQNYEYSNQFFFVCLTGVPPFERQFEDLDLPGQKIVFTPKQFSNSYIYTDQQYTHMYNNLSLQHLADRLHSILLQISTNISHKNKKLVILFHSFGGFIITQYFHKYKPEQYKNPQIFGYIDIGSIPVTMYRIIKQLIAGSLNLQEETMLENVDFLYQAYRKESQQTPTAYIAFSNKYHLINFMKLIRGKQYEQLFYNTRHNGTKLKLFLYGKLDAIFTQSLLAQKVIHYSYFTKSPLNLQDNTKNTQYQNKLKQAYRHIYGHQASTGSIQEHFIIGFQNGKHSIHMQTKLQPDIRIAIRQYLMILDYVDVNVNAKVNEKVDINKVELNKSKL